MIRYYVFFIAACFAAGSPPFAAADPAPQEKFSFLTESPLAQRASGRDPSSIPSPVQDSESQVASESPAALVAYSPLHAVYGSAIGFGLGAVIGAVAMKPTADACLDGVNDEDAGSFCGLNTLFGMAIGGAFGYSLAVPVGGHFSQGLMTRKFAINMAAITVLSGVLVYANWRIFDSGEDISLQYTIPLSVVAPHLASYLIGR